MSDYSYKKIDFDLSDLDLLSMKSDVILHNPRNLPFYYFDIGRYF